ncbi:MAG: sulfite exporter TauE/SafE family protein [Fibrobacterales bacterium]
MDGITLLTVIGYFSALFIGISLGMIGGGGSILTVPILVYLFGIEPMLATAYSLFVVGSSSLLGTVSYFKKGLLNLKTGLIFALPSIVAVFLTRKYLLDLFPDSFSTIIQNEWVTNTLFGITLLGGLAIAAIVLKKASSGGQNISFYKVYGLMVPAALMVFVIRQYLIPIIPEAFSFGEVITITKGSAIMMLFGMVMFFASYGMIREKKGKEHSKSTLPQWGVVIAIIFEGMLVGTVTGIVGAGGGFLIIPALVLLAGLPMKVAVGTSLAIISVKSLLGFLGDVSNQEIDWSFLILFSSISLGGIFIGSWLNGFISAEKLKKGFGWFVLVMAVVILSKEIIG